MSKQGRVKGLVLGLVLILVGFFIIWRGQTVNEPRVKIGNSTILVEIAKTPEEINQGLSGKQAILPNQGMLFIFEDSVTPAFWMKDMLFALDFVWITEDLKILAITPSIGVDSYPFTFSPPSPIKYVLEVNAGISADRGWLPGDTVELKL